MEEGATPTTTHDDEAALAALEALESVMTALSSPGAEFNRELHQTHLELAASAGLEDQVTTARTMMVQSVACGDGQSYDLCIVDGMSETAMMMEERID